MPRHQNHSPICSRKEAIATFGPCGDLGGHLGFLNMLMNGLYQFKQDFLCPCV